MKTRTSIATLAIASACLISSTALAQEPSSSSAGPSRITTLGPAREKSPERSQTIPGNRADFNHSGSVDVQDIFDYLTGWFAGKLDCDINNNGVLEGLDILEYINIWFAAPTASVSTAG